MQELLNSSESTEEQLWCFDFFISNVLMLRLNTLNCKRNGKQKTTPRPAVSGSVLAKRKKKKKKTHSTRFYTYKMITKKTNKERKCSIKKSNWNRLKDIKKLQKHFKKAVMSNIKNSAYSKLRLYLTKFGFWKPWRHAIQLLGLG